MFDFTVNEDILFPRNLTWGQMNYLNQTLMESKRSPGRDTGLKNVYGQKRKEEKPANLSFRSLPHYAWQRIWNRFQARVKDLATA